MEVVLNNLELVNNKYISHTFSSGTITGICGNSRRKVGNAIVKGDKNVLFSVDDAQNNISYVPLKKKVDTTRTAKEELMSELARASVEFSEYLIDDVFKYFDVELEMLDKRISSLTALEQKVLLITSALISDKDFIVLDSIEKNMHYKIKEGLKKLLRKLAKDNNKTIIVISNDLSFLFELVDEYILVNDGELVTKGSKNAFYNPVLYEYLDMPPIVDFTNYINEMGHKIKEYTEVKEILKAIYRDIENKRKK